MTADERARDFVEKHATGVNAYTFGFNAWEFKGWLADAIRQAVLAEREACAALVIKAIDPGDNPHDRGRLEEVAGLINARPAP